MSTSRPSIRAVYRTVPWWQPATAVAVLAMVTAAAAHSTGNAPLPAVLALVALASAAHVWLTRTRAVLAVAVVLGYIAFIAVLAPASVVLRGEGSVTLNIAAMVSGALLTALAVTGRAGRAVPARLGLALAVHGATFLLVCSLSVVAAAVAAPAVGAVAALLVELVRSRRGGTSTTPRLAEAVAAAPDTQMRTPRVFRGLTRPPEAVIVAPAGLFVAATVEAFAQTVSATWPIVVGDEDLTGTATLLLSQRTAVAKALHVGSDDPVALLVLHRSALTGPVWIHPPAAAPVLVVPTTALPALLSEPVVADDATRRRLLSRLDRAARPRPW